MFSSFLYSNNKLLVNRLARAQATILGLSLSTKEEYLAQITSIINGAINTGYGMQDLISIAAQTPGVVGDPITNLMRLNDDAADIAAEINRLEDDASTLFNLSAASRNSICQQIREAIYASTASRFNEQFVNKNQIDSASSANFDLNAGVAQLPLTTETVLTPVFSVGQNSTGSTTDDITTLSASTTETLFTWDGTLLEVIVSFPTPTIVNPDKYDGYEITTFTASADGTLFEDILADLNVPVLVLDAAAGKYSGSTIVDFPPRSVSKIRLIFQNLVAGNTIGLRALTFTQRSYQATGSVISSAQTSPTGQVLFQPDASVYSPYVSVTHQISSDSVHYTTIQPGLVNLSDTWWYRALLNRSTSAFASSGSAVAATTADPSYSTGFTLVSSSSIPLSPTIIERTLVFSNVTASIPLAETPLPNTLQVTEGTLGLNSSAYSFDEQNNLTINNPSGNISVVYQTSAQGTAGIAALQNYYTPLLTSVQFEKQ
jgi:hypothetical protein